MRQWGHVDVLNDMDTLPAEILQRITGYPIQSGYGEDYVATVALVPSRHEIESGQVRLVSLGTPDSENAGHWMLARQKGWLIAQAYYRDKDHWIHPHVRYIESDKALIEPQSETSRTQLEGRWVWPLVILCESIRICVGDQEAIVVEDGVCCDDQILVPPGETSGEPVRQLSSFIDEHERYRESDMEADCDALAALIRRLRSTDPAATLGSLLSDLGLGKYPLLHGQRFEVTVGVGAMPGCSVELVGTDAAPLFDGDSRAER